MLTHPIFTNYLITENGDVINKKTGRMIKSSDNGTGYLQVCLRKDKKSHFRLINRLVMETYDPIENQHLYHAHHNNEIRDDNRLENLEWELIGEHLREHKKGKVFSEEHRKKLSESHKGQVVSEETRRKMREAHKGKMKSEETRRRMSEGRKGKCKGKVLSEETKRKIGEGSKGRCQGTLWWNNGTKTIRSKECPGEGWMRGRITNNNVILR